MRLHDEVFIPDGAGRETAFPWRCRRSQDSMCHIAEGLYLCVFGKEQLILFIEIIPEGRVFGKKQLLVSQDISIGDGCPVPPTFADALAERRCD